MEPQPIPATAEIAITLQAQQWNVVLSVLSEAPYKLAQPIIEQITAQAQAPQRRTEPNGAEHASLS